MVGNPIRSSGEGGGHVQLEVHAGCPKVPQGYLQQIKVVEVMHTLLCHEFLCEINEK